MNNRLDLLSYWESWPEGFKSESLLQSEFIPPFFYDIVEKVKPKHIIELGTYKGKSILQMMKVCDDLGIYPHISCIDTWLGSAEHIVDPNADKDLLRDEVGYPRLYYTFYKNLRLSGFLEKFHVNVIPLDTNNAFHLLNEFNKEGKVIPPDFIFVDAGHDYNNVKMDIQNYWSVLEKGGVMFGDDYQWESVKNAVEDCFGSEYQITKPTGLKDYKVFYQYWCKFKE